MRKARSYNPGDLLIYPAQSIELYIIISASKDGDLKLMTDDFEKYELINISAQYLPRKISCKSASF